MVVITPPRTNSRHQLHVNMPAAWTSFRPPSQQSIFTPPASISKTRSSSSPLPPFPEDRFIAHGSIDGRALDAAHDGAEVMLTTIEKPLHETTRRRLECLGGISHPHVQATVGLFDNISSVCLVQSATSSDHPLLQEVMYMHGYTEAQLRVRALALLKALHVLHTNSIVHGNLTLDSLHMRPHNHLVLHVPGQLDPWYPQSFPATAKDKSLDMFSFGVVLYLLASGRHPFASSAAASTSEILYNMDTLSFVVDRLPLGHLSSSAQHVILDCLDTSSQYVTPLDLLQRQWFKASISWAAIAPSSSSPPVSMMLPRTSAMSSTAEKETYTTMHHIVPTSSARWTISPVARNFTHSNCPPTTTTTHPSLSYAAFGQYESPPPMSLYSSFPYTPPSSGRPPPASSLGRDLARSMLACPSPAITSLLPTRHPHEQHASTDTPSTTNTTTTTNGTSPVLPRHEPTHVYRHIPSVSTLHSTHAVKFSAYGPPVWTPYKKSECAKSECRIYIWAYLAHQVHDMRELAALQVESGRLSKGLHVGFGATITIMLEPPAGWSQLGELTKSLIWIEEVDRVFFDLTLDEGTSATEATGLCRARIVVGTQVAILHFSLPRVTYSSSFHPSKLYEHDKAVEYASSMQVVAAVQPPSIPRHHLTFIEPVGSGFFGTAYKAMYHPTNQEVVVKSLRQGMGISRAEFDHEVLAMTMLSHHPHVVDFLGACDDASELSIVMEYVANGSLQSLLYDSAKPQPRYYYSTYMKTLFARDAAHGILNIHQGHFVHRDIAARNCLVDDTFHVKVCDFGLSRPMDRMMGHVLDPVSCGPLKWMAPESLELPHVFSTASDTYMFGVLLFEIMMGKEPFPLLPPHEAAALGTGCRFTSGVSALQPTRRY
ncbi:serine/threonine protein kinase, variant 1 [Aphanomyces astaci]|uniref:Serine/threonine protein kinase, variant 1 n=1 Tax=Aphanomyces astaci TaxID=112090 RepID=W4G1L1_APHAT|nr:serine/threonine protein kinase, variant 1 [Aphanomyces astaci]ETV73161.1 serine/threonine protein kinase, variant 1 [Aphanomyces astaci]|eukprot:XP_009837365.1 serine/threonine protein kinase, variant 1 [Aphanomyces astaci]